MISLDNLHKQIAAGEDSTRQFKADVRNAESLALEMAAFANCEGGTLFIGVADDGSILGTDQKGDVSRINQLVSNVASHLVRSPLAVQTENVVLENGRVVIVLTVPEGIDTPYFDQSAGQPIWTAEGRPGRPASQERRDLAEDRGDNRRVYSKEN